jgi:alginate O-acetyltransferase complex protein AlgI
MLFYAPVFLFIFLPITLTLFFVFRAGWREWVLLTCSLLFYAWGEPKFFPVAVGSALADFVICQQLYLKRGEPTAKKYLWLGIGLNLLLLAYFKYFNFALESLNGITHLFGVQPWQFLKVVLPMGISFIVFEKITYLVDVYRGVGRPAKSFRHYLLYVFLFPKLLAGPIVKYHDVANQLENPQHHIDDFFIGFRRFLMGMAKKLLLADTLSEVADAAFAVTPEYMGFRIAWLGAIYYGLQIYMDFSAYSDMAIGLGRIFGFRLMENFRYPYSATSFTDFWRRWHISLSTWIREYLYIPLGGNRRGTVRTYFNLWFCFLASGLWHGASWTFVLWGGYHGLFLALDKLFWLKVSQRIPALVNVLLTVLFVLFGWVLFRAGSLDQFTLFLKAMFSPSMVGFPMPLAGYQEMALGLSLFMSFVPALPAFHTVVKRWRNRPWSGAVDSLLLTAIGLFAIGKAVTTTFSPFLYLRF